MTIRKRFFKLLAVVMSVILLISSVGLNALAAGNTPVGTIEALDSSFDADTYSTFMQNYGDAVSEIYTGIANMESSVDLYEYRIPYSNYLILYALFYHTFPELCYLDNFQIYTYGNYLYQVEMTYTTDAATMKQAFLETAQERYLSLVDDSMDDFTKAIILHDALVLNTYYPDLNANPNNTGNNYTYMVNGWGVCQYYSECYAYLLAQCGIKSEIISSSSMNHAWLKIRLNGQYYNVDSTWDDPTPDRGSRIHHGYFLYSDSVFQTADAGVERNRAHTGYQSIHAADATTYDSYDRLHDLETQLCYLDGAFYAITSDGKLVVYDPATDGIAVQKTLNYSWSAGSGYTWVGNFSALAAYNGKLYYNSPNAVYEYDPATGQAAVFAQGTESGELYGLRIINNQLWGIYADSPNVGYISPIYMRDMPVPAHTITIDDSIIRGTVTADKSAAVADESVTLTVSPEDGYVIDNVTVNGTAILPDNDVYSFVMPDEDVTVSASFGFADGVAALAGYSVSLEGDIGVQFYMDLNDSVVNSENAYLLFTLPAGSETVTEQVSISDAVTREENGRTYYVFRCGVSAKDMSSAIKAQIVDGETYGTEYSYSVKEYADYLLENVNQNPQYAAAAPLIRSMLNYGAYSQVFFQNNINHLANANLAPEERQLGDVTPATIDRAYTDEAVLPAGATFEGASLSLKSETVLSLWFLCDEELSFSCGNRTIQAEQYGEYQILNISGITAGELGDDFTVTVSAGGNSGAVVYSPMNYCYNVLNGNYDSELQDVVKSLYTYWQAAEAYLTV